MFNARSVHVALLGLILGSATAYVYGTYQSESRRSAEAAQLTESLAAASADHSEVTDEEMLALFDQALAENPNNAELKTRYGNFLFNLRRYGEAVDMYRLVLENTPDDPVVRTDLGTALYNLGRVDEAMANYERALASDPGNVLALHNVAIAQLESLDDVAAAETTIRRIESIDPNYPGLGNATRQAGRGEQPGVLERRSYAIPHPRHDRLRPRARRAVDTESTLFAVDTEKDRLGPPSRPHSIRQTRQGPDLRDLRHPGSIHQHQPRFRGIPLLLGRLPQKIPRHRNRHLAACRTFRT